MLIRFTKKRDGTTTLTCVRGDGSVTGQRQKHGFFFVPHDLGHYAIETTLNLRLAFYGLLCRGWEITDFGTPWPRGPIPPDAIQDAMLAEHLAGMLDGERAGILEPQMAADTNALLAAQFAALPGAPRLRVVTDDELARIRATAAELLGRWHALPVGETLELPFPAALFRAVNDPSAPGAGKAP